MPHFHRLAGTLLLVISFPSFAWAARMLNRYDLDSLCAMSTLIVRGEIGDTTEVKTRDGDCVVGDVTVLATIKGEAKPKSVIRVAGIESYRKGPGIDGADKSYPQLANGDIVYLFLMPKGARGGYSMYGLTDADWKIIESGCRLIVQDRVHTFGQYTPPGPSMGPIPGAVAATEKTFPRAPVPTVESFEEQLQASLKFVDDLRRKLADGSLTNAERDTILRSRREVLQKHWARNDYIPTVIYDEPRETNARP